MSDDGFKGYSRPPSFLKQKTQDMGQPWRFLLAILFLVFVMVAYFGTLYVAVAHGYASPAAQAFIKEHGFVIVMLLSMNTFCTAFFTWTVFEYRPFS